MQPIFCHFQNDDFFFIIIKFSDSVSIWNQSKSNFWYSRAYWLFGNRYSIREMGVRKKGFGGNGFLGKCFLGKSIWGNQGTKVVFILLPPDYNRTNFPNSYFFTPYILNWCNCIYDLGSVTSKACNSPTVASINLKYEEYSFGSYLKELGLLKNWYLWL